MSILEISKALNSIPTAQSDFEFENFFIETFPTRARQLVAVMLEIEKLYAEKLDLELSINNDSNNNDDIVLKRRLITTTQKLNRLHNWYATIPSKERNEILKNYENEEPTYWANVLGRRAAMEVLTDQRTSKETMDAMSNLPVNEFEESVRICVKYVSLIRNTTEDAEYTMESHITGLPQR